MAGKKQLPPVWVAGDEDSPSEPMGLLDAISSGKRIDELRAMLLITSRHIVNPNTLPRDLAALMRQQREMSIEIEELEALEAAEREQLGVSKLDAEDTKFNPHTA